MARKKPNALRKLTDNQARFILDCMTVNHKLRLDAGWKRRSRGIFRKLGERFNVSSETVRDVARRRTYKWLPVRSIYEISEEHRRMAIGDID